MNTIFIILAVLSLVFTLTKLIKMDAWWIRMFDFPQAQITLVALVTLAGMLAYTDWSNWLNITLIVLLTGAVTYQLTIIVPYTFFFPVQTKKVKSHPISKDKILSITVVNVYQFNDQTERCLEVVRKNNPHIVIAVETDDKWDKAFSVLKKDYPYNCLIPLDNTYGMLLYSKFELIDTDVRYLISENVPSIKTRLRLPSGTLIWLYCVHPEPPSPTENERSTERDAELYLVGKETRSMDEPIIVAGDLNDVAWSKSTSRFQRVSRLSDPRVGRGFYNTFHAKYPLLRWPLDHIFHSEHFELLELKRLEKTGSDHFPMFVSFVCDHDNSFEREIPKADEQDMEEAHEKIDEADPLISPDTDEIKN